MKPNRSIPPGPVIPVLVYEDVAAAVEWLCSTLGFAERVRIPPNHRTQLTFPGGGSLIVTDTRRERQAADPDRAAASVMLRVDDVDSLVERARAAGARIATEPTSWPYGERQAELVDPYGHWWTLSQTLEDVDPESWGGTSVAIRKNASR